MFLILFFIAIIPVFVLAMYIYVRDREKESFCLLLKLFLFGIFACLPSFVLSDFISGYFPELNNMNLMHLFFYVFIAIALVEEFCKWFLVYRITYNHNEFDTVYDMIVYSSFIALGFACLENILYVESLGLMVGFARALYAVPGHLCDGILMGFYLGFSKLNNIRGNKMISKKYKILSILIPVITHSIYDFCIFAESDVFFLIFSIFIVILYVICFKKVKEYSKNDIKIL